MKTEYYWIEGPWRGRLAIVPRPRGGDWLEDEIHSWREAGLDTIVALLTPAEVEESDVGREEELSRAQDIEFISFPIPDREVPTSHEAMIALAHRLEGPVCLGIHARLEQVAPTELQKRLAGFYRQVMPLGFGNLG
jgi:hypothetical protein